MLTLTSQIESFKLSLRIISALLLPKRFSKVINKSYKHDVVVLCNNVSQDKISLFTD